MELYKLHMLRNPPKLPNGPATYQLLIAREASQSPSSVQSANFPSWDSLAWKLASIGVSEDQLQKAKRELDVDRYYKITGLSLSPAQIDLLGFIHELRKTR